MGNKNLRPSNDVISRQVGDERVLVHLQSNEMYSLNATGARAWELLSDGQDEDAIAATLSDEYDIDRGAAQRELDTLLADFERHHLVEPA